ncbi:MAG TPA: hypothetical protein VF031_07770 [Alphaproteobacteria bacterium]
MPRRKDQDREGRAWATRAPKSPDEHPRTESRSAEQTDRSESRMTIEQQRRLRELCERSGTEFVERLTPEEAEARIAELERILR